MPKSISKSPNTTYKLHAILKLTPLIVIVSQKCAIIFHGRSLINNIVFAQSKNKTQRTIAMFSLFSIFWCLKDKTMKLVSIIVILLNPNRTLQITNQILK